MKNKVFLMVAFGLVLLVGEMGNVAFAQSTSTYRARLAVFNLIGTDNKVINITDKYQPVVREVWNFSGNTYDKHTITIIFTRKNGGEDRFVLSVYPWLKNIPNHLYLGGYYEGTFKTLHNSSTLTGNGQYGVGLRGDRGELFLNGVYIDNNVEWLQIMTDSKGQADFYTISIELDNKSQL
jgi:hypothetical protein